jgi:hypothetical protein
VTSSKAEGPGWAISAELRRIYKKASPCFSSPVQVTALAIGCRHSPQAKSFSAQCLSFLRRQDQFLGSLSYEAAQAAPKIKPTQLEVSRKSGNQGQLESH